MTSDTAPDTTKKTSIMYGYVGFQKWYVSGVFSEPTVAA